MAILRHDFEFFSLCLGTDGVEAFLRLDGDIDGDCVEALNDAVGHLRRYAPQRLFIDLGGVAFAGATLVNFLVRVVHALPTRSTTTLCRPGAETVRLLRLTSAEGIAEMRHDLPAAWPALPARAPAEGRAIDEAVSAGMAVIDADGLYLGLLTLPASTGASSHDRPSDFEIECEARNRRWHGDWAQVMWVVDYAVRLNVTEQALASFQPMLSRVTGSSKATAA